MDLGAWLRGLGLEEYEAAFRQNHIDDSVLPNGRGPEGPPSGVLVTAGSC
jgi:hypothetical protein